MKRSEGMPTSFSLQQERSPDEFAPDQEAVARALARCYRILIEAASKGSRFGMSNAAVVGGETPSYRPYLRNGHSDKVNTSKEIEKGDRSD